MRKISFIALSELLEALEDTGRSFSFYREWDPNKEDAGIVIVDPDSGAKLRVIAGEHTIRFQTCCLKDSEPLIVGFDIGMTDRDRKSPEEVFADRHLKPNMAAIANIICDPDSRPAESYC